MLMAILGQLTTTVTFLQRVEVVAKNPLTLVAFLAVVTVWAWREYSRRAVAFVSKLGPMASRDRLSALQLLALGFPKTLTEQHLRVFQYRYMLTAYVVTAVCAVITVGLLIHALTLPNDDVQRKLIGVDSIVSELERRIEEFKYRSDAEEDVDSLKKEVQRLAHLLRREDGPNAIAKKEEAERLVSSERAGNARTFSDDPHLDAAHSPAPPILDVDPLDGRRDREETGSESRAPESNEITAVFSPLRTRLDSDRWRVFAAKLDTGSYKLVVDAKLCKATGYVGNLCCNVSFVDGDGAVTRPVAIFLNGLGTGESRGVVEFRIGEEPWMNFRVSNRGEMADYWLTLLRLSDVRATSRELDFKEAYSRGFDARYAGLVPFPFRGVVTPAVLESGIPARGELDENASVYHVMRYDVGDYKAVLTFDDRDGRTTFLDNLSGYLEKMNSDGANEKNLIFMNASGDTSLTMSETFRTADAGVLTFRVRNIGSPVKYSLVVKRE